MAKKKTTARRVPRSVTPRTFGDGMPSQTAQEAIGTLPANDRPVVQPTRTPRRPLAGYSGAIARARLPLAQEYRHVPGDLRRLGIVAGVIFAIMIVLGIAFPLLGI